MADLEQAPGELNLSFIGGDDFTFTASILGDLSAYTHSAYVLDGHKQVATFTVLDVYSAPNTVITFTLSDTQTLAAIPNTLTWFYTQEYSGVTRTVLSGTVEVLSR